MLCRVLTGAHRPFLVPCRIRCLTTHRLCREEAKPPKTKHRGVLQPTKEESNVASKISERLRKVLLSNTSGDKKEEDASTEDAGQNGTNIKEVIALPVTQRPLFPGYYRAINIKDTRVQHALKDLHATGVGYLGTFLAKNASLRQNAIAHADDVYKTGVFAQVVNLFPGPNHSLTAVLFPHRRILLKNLQNNAFRHAEEDEEKGFNAEKPSVAQIENLSDEPFDADAPAIKQGTRDLLTLLKEIATLNPLVRDQIADFSKAVTTHSKDEPGRLADFAAALSAAAPSELQAVLSALNIEERLQRALRVLNKEREHVKLQSTISQRIDEKVTSTHKKEYLEQQLAHIQKELGIAQSSRDKMIAKYKERAKTLVFPEAVKKVFDEEIAKFAFLRPSAQEYHLTNTYIDWLTSMPFGQVTEDVTNLQKARAVLNADHFGLKDVKERILEFIATAHQTKKVGGKIICLVGPPGVGKSSIAVSIAKALDREFYRFSVGGLYDVAEIKGHRRTYIGAMPGKFVQALKKTKKENPLILIDEIDKIGEGGHRGQPSSALLEVLDPEQNVAFLDHYLDVPIDLSKVLFVCTANTLDTIPGPLLDRMEVIRLPGYITAEKVAITERHLLPAILTECGLTLPPGTSVLTPETTHRLITSYAREAGIRNTKKLLEKMIRKVVHQAFKTKPADINAAVAAALPVTVDHLQEAIGPPPFASELLYDTPPIGVTCGLAWNGYGGALLHIETLLAPSDAVKEEKEEGQARLHHTGHLGDVMKESAHIAYSFAKAFLHQRGLHDTPLHKRPIYLHVPAGATPKDGPSAGIAMASSMISQALQRALPNKVAMTGEISLTGKVWKIGGVKEKTIAASRAGITTILLPKANQGEWTDLDEDIRKGITPVFVDHYDDVFAVLFPTEGASAAQP